MSNLTNKERLLLQDQLSHEEICIRKYSEYASRSRDSKLRSMFYEFADEEMRHYDTIQGLLGQSGQNSSGSQSVRHRGIGENRGNRNYRESGNTQRTNSYSLTDNRDTGLKNEYGARFGDMEVGRLGSNDWRSEGAFTGDTLNRAGQAGVYTAGQSGQSGAYREGGASQDIQGYQEQGIDSDKAMLTDMLMTEKYISGTYDTVIFETTKEEIRRALQQIQEDEQKHGERIAEYMQKNGMYQAQ